MSSQIGAAGVQVQPNIIQNSISQNAGKAIERQVQDQSAQKPAVQQNENQNFQKLAEQIIAKRAEGTETVKPDVGRGQVLDLLV